jgi:molybdate transport system permease protein
LKPESFEALWITLQVAAGATALLALPAIALGQLLASREFRGKSALETCLAMPLFLPPTAIGYVLLASFSRYGWLGEERLGFDPGVLFTRRGAVLASAVVAFPLAVRAARSAFEAVDPRLVRMAGSLGHTRLQCFLRVSLPLARRGVLAALLLAFGRALGEFGATVILAGNIPGRTQTIALAIFNDIQLGDHAHALRLVGLCAALALLTTWAVERLSRAPRRRGA